MFDQPIRPEGSTVSSEELKQKKREYMRQRRAEQRAMKLATGKAEPKEKKYERETKSVVNRVTEYGALFNKLNQERVTAGLPQLKTAMEVLIEAMQSDELELKEKAKIAEKLATFESSRAPVISIEHVQNIQKEEELDAEDAMTEFLNSLRKV
jgi:hypothetical protein